MSRNLLEPVAFDGTLTSSGLITVVAFNAKVDARGRLHLEIQDIPLDGSKYHALSHSFSQAKAEWLELHGRSPSGHAFASKHFHISSLGTRSGDKGAFITIKGKCGLTEVTLPDPYSGRAGVRAGLRGFRTLAPQVECKVHGHGCFKLSAPINIDEAAYDDVTSVADIWACDSQSVPAEEWYTRSEKMLEDLLLAFSFATGIKLTPRVIWQFTPEKGATMKIWKTADVVETNMAAVSEFSYQSFLEAITQLLNDKTAPFEEIRFALEWITMPASHAEVRVFSAATALEHLIGKGLSKEERALMPDTTFKSIQDAIKAALQTVSYDTALHNRMLPSNEAGLRTKIDRLLVKWGATTSDFTPIQIRDAVDARNKITHRGVYEDPTGKGVWPHAMVLRELVLRLLFARIGFSGRYISFLDKYHERLFPQCTPFTYDAIKENGRR